MDVTVKQHRGRPRDDSIASRRREAILDMAVRVFAEQGYRKTDLQVVADMLGVGKGTVYRYFPSKEALFLGTVDRGMRQMQSAVDAAVATADDPLDRIARGIQAYLEFFSVHPEICELLVQERAEFKDRKKPTYFEHRKVRVKKWQELYRGLIAAGRVRDLTVEQISDVVGQLIYGTMFANYFAGGRKPAKEQTRDILEVVFYGILSESERGSVRLTK
jgi:AcrR family transcriptional regulator